MPAPAGPPHLPVLFSATALALLTPLELAAAETREEINQAIHAGLPRYDPAAYTKAQAEKVARSAPKNVPAPLPEAKTETAAAAAPAPTAEKIFELPSITVRPEVDLPKMLPRVDPPPRPLKDLPAEPYESASGRDARLVKKHLNKLQQILYGKWAVAEARAAEFREQRAAQMDRLAAMIEMQTALGGLDPEVLRQIRDEYEKLYYSGPK